MFYRIFKLFAILSNKGSLDRFNFLTRRECSVSVVKLMLKLVLDSITRLVLSIKGAICSGY
jgi:hypothetical protein